MSTEPGLTRSARHQSARRGRASRRRSRPESGPEEGPSTAEPTGSSDVRRAKPASPGRAGRDLTAAIIVGVALGAAVVASLFIRREAFLLVVALAILVAVWEMRTALVHAQVNLPVVPVAVGAVSMIVGAYVAGGEALTVTLGLTVVAVLLWRVADGVSGAVPDVTAGFLVVLYPCFLAGFASMMLAEPDGQWRIVTFIVVTICSDIGGYAAGVFLGKHPMAPSVSPKKSWEGFGGSVLACAVAGMACVGMLLDGPWLPGAALGVVVAIGATVGDLMESTIKRDLGIKDMSSILPGHGGLMDRLDSLLMTVPIVWAGLIYLVPA